MKTRGRILIPIGWIFIALSIFATIGMFLGLRHRDISIEAFLNHLGSLSLVFILGIVIGSNLLNWPALFIGIYSVIRKNPKGKPIIITSIVLFLIVTSIQFLPSSDAARESLSGSQVITHPQSEFQVTFPHPVKRRLVTVGDVETVGYESLGPEADPYLRAEFMNNIDTASIGNNFIPVLENHAILAGLSLPEITVTQDHLGKVGTYSGIKTVGDVAIKIYGKMVLGEHSALNCLVCEELQVFPSEESTNFLISIKRK